MIDAIELENFKAFGKRVRVKLAPITLFFGENSAGKSSILQALTLLEKSCMSAGKHDPLLVFQSEDGSHDLGSFSEVIFNHEVKRDLKIRVDLIDDGRPLLRDPSLLGRHFSVLKDHPVGMEFVFSRKNARNDISLTRIDFFSQKDGIGKIVTLKPFGNYFTCSWLTESNSYWESAYEIATETVNSTAAELEVAQKTLNEHKVSIESQIKEKEALINRRKAAFKQKEAELYGTRKIHDEYGEMYSDILQEEKLLQADLRSVVLFKSFCMNGLKEFVRYQKDQLIHEDPKRGWHMKRDGFLPQLGTLTHRFSLSPRLSGNFSRISRRAARNEELAGHELSIQILEAAQSLVHNLSRLDPLGPFRQTPKRVYQFQGTIPPDVGYEGEYVPQLLFRDRALLDRANNWMEKLNIGYTIKPENIGKKDRDLFEIRLVDSQSRNSDVSHAISDVGFGISQLLPFIVKCLLGKNKIISIEQPEVHVHPRLQADLGDLLVDSIGNPTNHQFLIETHSEHLILRLQRLIRDGKLKPSDLSVIYVSRGKEGSEITYLPLNERGNFIEEWPGGFFPERMKEIL